MLINDFFITEILLVIVLVSDCYLYLSVVFF